MKAITVPIISKNFRPSVSKTAIEVSIGGQVVTIWANGDQSGHVGLLANLVVNEPGDSFIAGRDSSRMDEKNKPLYKKGDKVVRDKISYDFKSFAGSGNAAQFAQAASAFGLQLNVVMQ